MTEFNVTSGAAELFRSCCNWNRWGNDDQLGTLNYITPEVTLAAMDEVHIGRTVSLARTLEPLHSTTGPAAPVQLHMLDAEGPEPITCGEVISLRVHGMDKTHSDALGHEFWLGQTYGGRRASEIITGAGLTASDTLAQAGGVVTRGVLLDVCAGRGARWLEPGEGISAADLEAAEALAGVRLRAGDAVVLHAGSDRRRAAGVPDDPSGIREGLLPECLPLLHERQVAVFAADCIERLPSDLLDMPFPLHQVGIAGMGLMLVDSVRSDRLVDACAEAGRSTCLFVVSPLPIHGGTGSPVNPLCIL